MTDTIEANIKALFQKIMSGNLGDERLKAISGWEMELPNGKTVTRSELQDVAGEAIALGVAAVPYLIPFVRGDEPAVRYVAIYALGQITGEQPDIPYRNIEDAIQEIEQAVDNWRKWYEEHHAAK